MSRRHKELEKESNYEPQQVESYEDGHQKKSRWTIGASSIINKLLTVTKRDKESDLQCHISEKIFNAIGRAFSKAFNDESIVVDDKWVKIPRSYFDAEASSLDIEKEVIEREGATHGRGRRFLNQLINTVADSKIVDYVKAAYKEAKKKVSQFIENTTQFCACCLDGLFKTFSPCDDPYGKLSHFHRLLATEFPDLQSRKTLSNYYKWLIEWKPSLTSYVGPKEKKNRFRHSLWEKLIAWICNYLKTIAPQYVFT